MTQEKEPSENEKKKKKENQEDFNEEGKKELEEILGQIKEKNQTEGKTEKKEESQSSESNPMSEPKEEQPEEEGIEKILEKITEKDTEPTEDLTFFQRIIGVFSRPTAVFQYLRTKPDFIFPILLAILISAATRLVTYDLEINFAIDRIDQSEKYTDEQKDMIIDRIESSRQGAMRYVQILVLQPLSMVIIYVVVSGIFLFIGNIILGGRAKFVHLLSVFSYAFLVLVIAGTIVKLPLILINQSIQVNTSLSLLMPDSAAQTTLYRFLSAFDIFTIWFLVVFSIGFSIIYHFSQLKSYLSVFITWLIWVILTKVVLGSLFATFTG